MHNEIEAALAAARPEALRVARRRLRGDVDAADEVVAIAIARVWQRSVKTGEVYGTAYTVQAVLNEIRSRWHAQVRRDRTLTRIADVARTDDVRRPDDIATERVLIEELLASLPAQQQRIVRLRYLAGYSQAEVAQLVGVAQGTVASSAARSLVALRELAAS